MDGSTVVALASVVSSAVVGLWVPHYSARSTDRRETLRGDREDERERGRQAAELERERLRLTHESVEKDLLELRALLDDFIDATFPLVEAVVALQSATSGQTAPDPATFAPQLERHRSSRQRVIDLQTRMIVRLGRQHRACVQAGLFIDAAEEAGIPVSTSVWLEQPMPADPAVYAAGRQRMFDERQRFLDVATQTVGARVRADQQADPL